MTSAAVLGYVASATLAGWGSAHLAPTRAVVASFGDITPDNRRILLLEWIAEGLTHISLGVLLAVMTAVEGMANPATHLAYRVVATAIIVLALLTARRSRPRPGAVSCRSRRSKGRRCRQRRHVPRSV